MAKILLVEDDHSFRKMLLLTLKRLGHEVREAQNGNEAIGLFTTEPYDLILTDLIMPEMEGIETIMRLRKSHPAVKIIAMSGGGRIKARDFLPVAKQLGAAETLDKPFTMEQLTSAIARSLSPSTQV